ncbi:hypothetical protein LT330_005885 [Penicillium expansum]|nr:hypothetical protein LT330_005885 [Penicillium expansum]
MPAPTPVMGTDLVPPFLWLSHLQTLLFPRPGGQLSGRYYIHLLRPLVAQREPLLRNRFPWIVWNLNTVEAALIQVVGVVCDVECINCLRGQGPFSQCVVVDGLPSLTCCANCHWEGRPNSQCIGNRLLPILRRRGAPTNTRHNRFDNDSLRIDLH